LHRGITQEQIIQVVGKKAVVEIKDDTLVFSTVPRPHPAFESYVLVFSPKDGLLKILAMGPDIRTNGFGEVIHDSFVEIRNAIAQTYGQPDNIIDSVRAGSIWTEPEDWMMGLYKGERGLACGWGHALPKGLSLIMLSAAAASVEKGYLRLTYQFDGWSEYAEAKAKKAGTVF
jgi:hypothetical protein